MHKVLVGIAVGFVLYDFIYIIILQDLESVQNINNNYKRNYYVFINNTRNNSDGMLNIII